MLQCSTAYVQMHITHAHGVKTRAYDNPWTNNKTNHSLQCFDLPFRGSPTTRRELSSPRALSKGKKKWETLGLWARATHQQSLEGSNLTARNPAAAMCGGANDAPQKKKRNKIKGGRRHAGIIKAKPAARHDRIQGAATIRYESRQQR